MTFIIIKMIHQTTLLMTKIDTEYNDINPKTNSKFIKNKEESDESVKKRDINDLFNSISLFSDN